MTIRRYGVMIAVLALCIATAGLLAYGYKCFGLADAEIDTDAGPRRYLPKLAKARAHLYFSDVDHTFLTAEDCPLGLGDTVVQRASNIIDALIEGPKGVLAPTIPSGTKALAVYVTENRVCYIDFSRAITENHPGGVFSELLTIFSVVNTLALNIPEIEAVKILIEGREAKTLAGHIDIRFPFRPNMLMIR